MRVEEFVDGDELVIRAEMPGIDPDNDVQVHVRNHLLELRAERKQETKPRGEGHPPERIPLRQLLPGGHPSAGRK